MKKSFFFAIAALAVMVGCNKMEPNSSVENTQNEIGIVALNGENLATRGYSIGEIFEDIAYEDLHDGGTTPNPRTMQLSAYLYPQNGDNGNYFVGQKFAKGLDARWHADPAIYWPIGGKMDFLAYSLSEPKNVAVAWDNDNAASKVTLSVPGENSQNDILYASASGIQSKSTASPVEMIFKHAQAWLEFNLSSNLENIVTLKSIVLENVYNAGELTISNNSGNAIAEWAFNGKAIDVEVDNNYGVAALDETPQPLDMLIPQQKKTSFVIYYTLGSDPQVLSYKFTTDLKTWLAGEKYVYNIKLNTSEITVDPKVIKWNEKCGFEDGVSLIDTHEIG